MFAHGFQVISLLTMMTVAAFAVVLFVRVSRDKSKALALAFMASSFGLSALFLYLMVFQK